MKLWIFLTMLTGAMYSLCWPVIQIILRSKMDILEVSAWILFFSGIICGLYLFSKRKSLELTKQKNLHYLLVLFGIIVFFYTFGEFVKNKAIKLAPSVGYITPISYGTGIILLYLYSLFVQKEPFNVYIFMGILLVIMGIWLINKNTNGAH